jgi:hypothetical protein
MIGKIEKPDGGGLFALISETLFLITKHGNNFAGCTSLHSIALHVFCTHSNSLLPVEGHYPDCFCHLLKMEEITFFVLSGLSILAKALALLPMPEVISPDGALSIPTLLAKTTPVMFGPMCYNIIEQ